MDRDLVNLRPVPLSRRSLAVRRRHRPRGHLCAAGGPVDPDLSGRPRAQPGSDRQSLPRRHRLFSGPAGMARAARRRLRQFSGRCRSGRTCSRMRRTGCRVRTAFAAAAQSSPGSACPMSPISPTASPGGRTPECDALDYQPAGARGRARHRPARDEKHAGRHALAARQRTGGRHRCRRRGAVF